MAKQTSTDTTSRKKEKKSKKGDAGKSSALEAPTAGFSLFGGTSKDAELSSVFSKGAAFARPVEPVQGPVAISRDPGPSTSGMIKETKGKKGTNGQAKKAKAMSAQPEISDGENDGDEPSPQASTSRIAPAATENDDSEEGANDEDIDSDDDADEGSASELVHESLRGQAKPAPKTKVKSTLPKKYTPPNESSADRDRRTLFVGNLPLSVPSSKSAQAALRAHLLTFAPSAKVESIRFRSVPFANPTASLPSEDPEKDESRRVKREKERAAAWKAVQDEDEGREKGRGKKRAAEDEDAGKDDKVFIDSKGKRKVAFIKKEFHAEGAACNAYVVFAYPHPDRPVNLPPILSPFDAAQAVLKADGTTFMERTIRVDTVRLPSSVALQTAQTALSKRDAWLPSGTDTKTSVFVGGLDYAAKEEDVRVFFEELIKAERGERKEDGGRWVTGVRIIRDKETLLGKGFGYVHFVDRESVDEVIAMDSKKLKFAKKPLRVQQCKSLPVIAKPSKSTPSASSASTSKAATINKPRYVKPASIPKGDPTLGDRLASLSKEDRKLAKSADADRLARRMAKKKMRGQMEKQEKGAVKLHASKGEKDRGKRKNVGGNKGKKRSERAVEKMKGSRV